MIAGKSSDMVETTSYFINKDIDENLGPEFAEKDIINVLDNYLRLNFCELYNQNNLEPIFKKAREDKEIEIKVCSVIRKFIHN